MDLSVNSLRNKKIYSAAVSFSILLVLGYLADFSKTFEVFLRTEPSIFALGFLVGNLTLFFQSYSWLTVFKKLNLEISYLETLKMKISCLFLDNITPFGGMGGETAVAYLISRSVGEKYSRILSVISFTGFSNLMPFLLLGFLGSLYLVYTEVNFGYTSIILFPLILGLLTITTIWRLKTIKKIIKPLILKIESSMGKEGLIQDNFEIFKKGLKTVGTDRNTVLTVFSMSILSFLGDILCFLILAISLSLEIEFGLLIILISISRLANFTPSIGGSGIYEATLTGLLATFSTLTAAEAFTISVLYRLTTTYFGTLAGFVSLNLRLIPQQLNPRSNIY